MKIKDDFAIEVDENEILKLLGDEKKVKEKWKDIVKEEIQWTKTYIKPFIIYEQYKIIALEKQQIILENQILLEGKGVDKYFDQCHGIIMAIATIGKEIDERIEEKFKTGDYIRGIILDYIGNKILGSITCCFFEEQSHLLGQSQMGLTLPLSPGDLHFSLAEQKKIFKSLQPEKIGISLNETDMMTPLKSISMIYGLGKGFKTPISHQSCKNCQVAHCTYYPKEKIMLTIHRQDRTYCFQVKAKTNLLEFLRKEKIWIESPCNGAGVCGKCKVFFVEGVPPPMNLDRLHLTKEELQKGIRLACVADLQQSATIRLLQQSESIQVMETGMERHQEKSIEADQRIFRLKMKGMNSTSPSYGLGVDIGTTTVVIYLMDLKKGQTIDQISGANQQRVYGADIITRIQYTIDNPEGLSILQKTIVAQLNQMIEALCYQNAITPLDIHEVVVVGNTVMLHLFFGVSCVQLAQAPYTPVFTEEVVIKGREIGLNVNGDVVLLPGVADYVGSDLTSAILASGMAEEKGYSLLVDLGTNGEMVLGNRDQMIACSTAAGPAFEGTNITWGMAGVLGAISSVDFSKDHVFQTIGHHKAIGICGSGVLDLVAQLRKYEMIDGTGRMKKPEEIKLPKNLQERVQIKSGAPEFLLTETIAFTQKDVREVQLAKGAIRAGIEVLLREQRIENLKQIQHVYIAGGFGNFMNVRSSLDIGLFPKEFANRIVSIGNAAGMGAKLCLISEEARKKVNELKKRIQYLELSNHVEFQDYFLNNINLP